MDNQHNHYHQLDTSPLLVGFLGIFVGFIIIAICHCKIILCNYMRGDNNSNVSTDRELTFRTNTMIEHSTIQVAVSKYYKECKEDLCAICLGEFKEGEGVGVLSECLHVFHVSCIDKWIENHPSCPLCRANTIPPSSSDVVSSGDSDGIQAAEEIVRMPEFVDGNAV